MKRGYARRRWLKVLRKVSWGMSVPDICREMKLDPSNVYLRLRRARRSVALIGDE